MTDCNARNALWMTGILLLSVSSAARSDDAEKKQPDMASLIKAGQATMKRLETQAASWTAITHLPSGVQIVVDVLGTPDLRRMVLSIEGQGRREEVFRIIVKDGLWYTTEGQNSGKYRPYEAPFNLPTAYFFLSRSQPYCVTKDQGAGLGIYQGTEDGVATYRTPLSGPMKEQLRNMLVEFEKLKRQRPDLADAKTSEKMKQSADLLENGLPLKVDLATGMFVQSGGNDRPTMIQNFSWMEEVDPEQFNVEGTRWEDYSDDPTQGDTAELLMISHGGLWSPGMKSTDTDGRLVDLRSGRFRRIPFVGLSVQTGCFLKDRTRVVVPGVDESSGVLGLYEINLKTGENRRLGGDLLASGTTLMPVLSPDGKTIAVMHHGSEKHLLDSHVCLVDLGTGEAKTLGEPHDLAYLSWLPDGQGLILLIRETPDPADLNSPRVNTISRMDLDGRISKIREGNAPILLNDGKTILFEDSKSRAWQTCDLNGGDVRPYAGGLTGYGFPSPSPDGKRIVMMHFRKGLAPVPTILQIGESVGRPTVTAPGLWALPAWR